jgi:hypothetical protein
MGRLTAHIPGIGHTMKKYAKVLVRGRGPRDLPGVRYACIRGVLDFIGLKKKKRRRSIYGAEQNNLLKIRARRKYRSAIKIAERSRVNKNIQEKTLVKAVKYSSNILLIQKKLKFKAAQLISKNDNYIFYRNTAICYVFIAKSKSKLYSKRFFFELCYFNFFFNFFSFLDFSYIFFFLKIKYKYMPTTNYLLSFYNNYIIFFKKIYDYKSIVYCTRMSKVFTLTLSYSTNFLHKYLNNAKYFSNKDTKYFSVRYQLRSAAKNKLFLLKLKKLQKFNFVSRKHVFFLKKIVHKNFGKFSHYSILDKLQFLQLKNKKYFNKNLNFFFKKYFSLVKYPRKLDFFLKKKKIHFSKITKKKKYRKFSLLQFFLKNRQKKIKHNFFHKKPKIKYL